MSQPCDLPLGARRIQLASGAEEVICAEEALFLDIAGTRLLSMRTPMGEAADLAWALGFLASEGVIEDLSEVKSMTFHAAADQNQEDEVKPADEVRVELWRPSNIDRLGSLARTHEMRASCGLCGVTSAAGLVKGLKPLASDMPKLSLPAIGQMVEKLRSNQPLFDATGGCHGAALLKASGDLVALSEDIGRHNALDRAIGFAMQKGLYLRDCVAVLSGRAGYEMVIKAVRVGVPIVLSIGAASSSGPPSGVMPTMLSGPGTDAS